MGKTLAEKILAKKACKSEVDAGQIVQAAVDVAMSHENGRMVKKSFEKIGVDKVWDPERIVIIFDHRVPAESERTAIGQKELREFVAAQGIGNFYDINVGVCHQVLAEEGFSRPGILLVGTDSHTTTAGALGAFATGIGATEMSAVWATGELWLKVPETLKIVVNGKLPDGVYSKDVVLKVIGTIGSDGADYKAMEYSGQAISDMTVASRMVISNLSMEAGAKTAFIIPDKVTEAYVKPRAKGAYEMLVPDPDASYLSEHTFDVSDLEPQLACPHQVDNVKGITEVAGTKIDQAVIGSCTNGRLEDLQEAARVLKGEKINPGVRLLIVPASWSIYREALKQGILETLIDAGAVVLNAGCGPCLGAHEGCLAPGETAVTSTNRNFQGRMGSAQAYLYLASPATVAASAIEGKLADPRKYLEA
ncbi:homoaconitate hydratase family protein [candidate division WOR-3 bacterium]|uniref:3-isopropylmalate dehydratase large subunit n=1 Tax=candidate division WOR-3 bacterium TaxID=2052148 RepID=A0A9D5QCS3_UNCW3|nr:homoaconitate hydratase family protein [candidate division WOR-3 bacterium]MBD3364978.1 homoaconitate hydratase family protein [candidate division WOR-3 bacterium]